MKRRKEVLGALAVCEEEDVHHPFVMVENY